MCGALKRLNFADTGDSGRRQRSNVPLVNEPLGRDPIESLTQSIRSVLARTKRQPLRLEVRVFHRQFEDGPIEVSILSKSRGELAEQAGFVIVQKSRQDRLQRVDVFLNGVGGLLRLARKRDRRLVGVSHHGPIGRVSSPRELHLHIGRETT
jgi:hypothetical protein